MRPKVAAAIGVAVAFGVGILAVAKWRSARPPPEAAQSTLAVRITERDRSGLPTKKSAIRDPARVRALVVALGVDDHPMGPCPADYADAPIGIVLSGADVYARRNVYVFAAPTAGEGGAEGASIVTVTSAGCRVGPPADPAAMRGLFQTATPLRE